MAAATLRTLIVDDEPIARQILREELRLLDDTEVIGEAENGERAIEQAQRLSPDLILLDLQMPGIGGFEVIRELERMGADPCIVIVTAYDQHAIAAFEAGAVDYLLKPVATERLIHCIERVRHLRQSEAALAEQTARLREIAKQNSPSVPRKIVGKLGEEYHLLDSNNVLAFQAERELVWILTAKQKYMATQSLKVIQERLGPESFVRIHRGTLVNLAHVAKMAPLSSQRWLLTLSTNQKFVVSKRQARTVQSLLSW